MATHLETGMAGLIRSSSSSWRDTLPTPSTLMQSRHLRIVLMVHLILGAVQSYAQVRLASLWVEGTTYYYYGWHTATGSVDTLWRFKANNDAYLYGRGRMAMGDDGRLYGTGDGGEWLRGALFSADTATGSIVTHHTFHDVANGYMPHPDLYHVGENRFVGTTTEGGANGTGVVYAYDATMGTCTDLLHFPADWQPVGVTLLHSDGHLYLYGGTSVHRYDVAANTLTLEFQLTFAQGGTNIRDMISQPDGSILMACVVSQGTNGRIYRFEPGTGVVDTWFEFIYNNSPTAVPSYPVALSRNADDGLLYVSCIRGGPDTRGGLVRINPMINQRLDLHYYTAQGEDLHDLHWAGTDTLLVTVNGYGTEEIFYHRHIRGGATTTVLHDGAEVDLATRLHYQGQRAYHFVSRMDQCTRQELRRWDWIQADMDTLDSLRYEPVAEVSHNMAVRPDGTALLMTRTNCDRRLILSYDPLAGSMDTVATAERSGGILSFMPLLEGDSVLIGGDAPSLSTDWYIYRWSLANGARDSIAPFPVNWMPITRLIGVGDGVYYCGGSSGTISGLFKVDLAVPSVELVHTLANAQGHWINEELLLASDGKLYGTARYGGINNQGTLFSYDPELEQFELIHQFPVGEAGPLDRLYERTEGGQQVLIGFISVAPGRAYRLDLGTNVFTWLTPLNTPGCNYWWSTRWRLASDGQIYSMNIDQGGPLDNARFHRVDPSTGAVTCLQPYDIGYGSGAIDMVDFTEIDGALTLGASDPDTDAASSLLVGQDAHDAWFSWTGDEPPAVFELYDVLGQRIRQQGLIGARSWRMSIGDLPSGLYFCAVLDGHGVRLATSRVMF